MPSRHPWATLPFPIRRQILERLACTANIEGHDHSRYASVSRDWQLYFEQITFRMLRIAPSDLTMFCKILRGCRRAFLKHLSYCVALRVDRLVNGTEDDMFKEAVLCLFRELRTWNPRRIRSGGLELELVTNISSDDAAHTGGTAMRRLNEYKYRVVHGAYDRQLAPVVPAVTSLVVTMVSDENTEDCKAAGAVTLWHRHPGTDAILGFTQPYLPRLTALRLERHEANTHGTLLSEPVCRARDHPLAQSLNNLTLCGSFMVENIFDQLRVLVGTESNRWLTALKSLSLICDSFDDSRSTAEPKKERRRRPGMGLGSERKAELNRLLHSAALAALQMPALQQVYICGIKQSPRSQRGRKSGNKESLPQMQLFRFQYEVVLNNTTERAAVATWSSTYPMRISSLVQRSWIEVARTAHRCDELHFVVKPDEGLALSPLSRGPSTTNEGDGYRSVEYSDSSPNSVFRAALEGLEDIAFNIARMLEPVVRFWSK